MNDNSNENNSNQDDKYLDNLIKSKNINNSKRNLIVLKMLRKDNNKSN